MFAPATQPQEQQPQHQKHKQSETASSAEDEALKLNTDCVYFLASPLTCKKGPECEYRHSEYARMNPRDCYYWLNGNCMNPKCGFRHPPLEGLLGNQGGAPTGSVQPTHAATAHPGVAKQPIPCVFFQKGMCMKGGVCSFLHTSNPAAAYKTQHPAEAKPTTDPLFPKKPVENSSVEKKFPDANLSKAVKAHADLSAAPRVTSAGLRDSRSIEGYVPKHVGYEPVVQKKSAGLAGHYSTQLLQKYGSDDNNSLHNGKDTDDVLRESSPGFDVLVDTEARDSEYYHAEDRYGRRSQEGVNGVNEYDPDYSAIADGDKDIVRDQRFDPYDQREDMYGWDHRRVSSEREDRSERRVYADDERTENILESDLRYRLAKQRKVNGTRSVGSHGYAAAREPSVERGYRESRRDTPRESSISSSRLQGRIKLRERSNGEEAHNFERRSERGRDRSELSSQSRLRDRIKGRLDESHSGNQERGSRAPWARRREMEEERRSAPRSIAETKSSKEESKTELPSLGKRKSLEEDHHNSHRRSGNSFAAPLTLSEILKRKRAAASGGSSNNRKDEMTSKQEAGDETELTTEEKTEVVSEPNPSHDAEVEDGTIMEGEEVIGEEVYEGEEQAYEGDELNGEYYYEEGYEEEGDYAYEEGAEGEEVVYAAEEGEGGEAEVEEDIEKKTVEMLL